MPRLVPRMDTGAISGTLLNLLILLLIIGFLVTVTLGGFLVWGIAAVIVVLVVYAILARGYYSWIGRR